MPNSTAEQIDALLPQTQCQKCGYPGCKPYAEAIAQGTADINQCPPGGEAGIRRLAELLGTEAKPLNPAFGTARPRLIAAINEADCIGCTKCMPPCPVDAIIGASKHMHTVITEQCTGCELCIPTCPVSCISMETSTLPPWNNEDASNARSRYQAKNLRLARLLLEKADKLKRQKQLLAKIKKPEPTVQS